MTNLSELKYLWTRIDSSMSDIYIEDRRLQFTEKPNVWESAVLAFEISTAGSDPSIKL